MLVRIITALIGIPLILSVMYYGGITLFVFIALLTLLGMKEYINILIKLGVRLSAPLLYIFAFLFPVLAQFRMASLESVFVAALLCIAVYLLVLKEHTFAETALHVFGVVYVGGTLSYIIQMRRLEDGIIYLLMTFIFIWTSDSAAYFVGKFFGKHKLAPKISPKKTIEGSLGGLLFTLLISPVFVQYSPLSVPTLLGFAAIVNFFAQTGDLVESAIKRQASIKDSGNLLPGHGGILDRFDSTFFAVPAVYQYIIYLTQ